MQIVTVEQPDHQVLREPAQIMPFPLSKEQRKFALNLLEKMEALGNAVGLAATQVGKPWRIIAFHITDLVQKRRKHVKALVPPTLLVNPSYEPLSTEKMIDWEGCFSVTNKMGEVPRYTKIHYQGYTIDGEKVTGIAEGFFARVIQHEVGHLNGELYIDLVTPDCRCGDSDSMMQIREEEFRAQQKNSQQ